MVYKACERKHGLMPIITLVDISRRDILVNRDVMFIVPATDKGIFHFVKTSNIVGIRVKAAPSTDLHSYWTDETYDVNVRKIDEDIKFIEHHLHNNGVVVLYETFIFDEINSMEKYGPKTVDYLFSTIQNLKDRYTPRGCYNEEFFNDKEKA